MPKLGRPPLPVGQRAVDKTKVVRLEKTVIDKIRSGYYRQLDALVFDYLCLCRDSSSSSPRFERLREFMDDYKRIAAECKVDLTICSDAVYATSQWH